MPRPLRYRERYKVGQGAGEWFSGRRESIPGGSDAAVQAAYALEPLPCSLRGAFMIVRISEGIGYPHSRRIREIFGVNFKSVYQVFRTTSFKHVTD